VQVQNKLYLLGGFNGSYISEGHCLKTDLKLCEEDFTNDKFSNIENHEINQDNRYHSQHSKILPEKDSTSPAINLENYAEWVKINPTGKLFTPRTGHFGCC
jgi:hypothetical protein